MSRRFRDTGKCQKNMEITNHNKILKATEIFVKEYFSENTDGHDWWHTQRVRNLSVAIAKKENNENLFLIEMIALLHDVDDWKITGNKELINTIQWLNKNNIEHPISEQICHAIKGISYKGAHVTANELSEEGKIVQDADRLDAIGAIGIARAFAYGGSKNRPIYIPDKKPVFHSSETEYRNSEGHTINHFYEKLLLLKDRMNTKSAKAMAEERHQFMETFLKQFYSEWK